MSELTYEKALNGYSGSGNNSGMFVTGNECYTYMEVIKFLLYERATIENKTAQKCVSISSSMIKGVRPFDKGYNEKNRQTIEKIKHHFKLGENQ